MDFKVAGTEKGITSIQMDIKIEGLDLKIMEQALEQARKGRLHILKEMAKALPTPRTELSKYAPRIFTMQIKPDKIGDVIGPKGKTIRGIQDATGAKISIEDSGLVTISAVGGEAGEKARADGRGHHHRARGRPDLRGPGQEHDGVRRVRRDPARASRVCSTSASCSTAAPRRPRTWSRRATSSRSSCSRCDERGRMKLSRKALLPKE